MASRRLALQVRRMATRIRTAARGAAQYIDAPRSGECGEGEGAVNTGMDESKCISISLDTLLFAPNFISVNMCL